MLKVTTMVNAPGWTAQGVKEVLAMTLERFGDVRVVEVLDMDAEPIPGQLEMEGGPP